MPFIFVAAALLAIAWAASGPSSPSSAAKVPQLQLATNWPQHVVVDLTKFRALGYTPTTTATEQYEGTDPRIFAQMIAANPAVAATAAGLVPAFVSGMLASGNRVWIGPLIQQETGPTPNSTVPLYVGVTPPAGFVEVTA